MRRLTVGEHWIEVGMSAPSGAGEPRVSLTLGVQDGPASASLILSPGGVRALVDALSGALTDPAQVQDASHEGHHPSHLPGPDPDALSHRPAIGVPVEGEAAYPRPAHAKDDPSR